MTAVLKISLKVYPHHHSFHHRRLSSFLSCSFSLANTHQHSHRHISSLLSLFICLSIARARASEAYPSLASIASALLSRARAHYLYIFFSPCLPVCLCMALFLTDNNSSKRRSYTQQQQENKYCYLYNTETDETLLNNITQTHQERRRFPSNCFFHSLSLFSPLERERERGRSFASQSRGARGERGNRREEDEAVAAVVAVTNTHSHEHTSEIEKELEIKASCFTCCCCCCRYACRSSLTLAQSRPRPSIASSGIPSLFCRRSSLLLHLSPSFFHRSSSCFLVFLSLDSTRLAAHSLLLSPPLLLLQLYADAAAVALFLVASLLSHELLQE